MPHKLDTTQTYSQHATKVFRYAMFKLGKKEDAEDVVSETFTRYLAKPNAEIVNLELWLIGIARNVIYEKIKKGKYREPGFSVIDGQELELADTSRALPVELTTSLQAALSKLDTDTREVIILKTWEELKFEEIADIMKLNTNTVKAKYYRGVEELKASINPPRDAQKVRSISTPLLLASIRMLAEAKEFTPDPEFLSSLKAQIGDKVNLINTNQNMNKQLLKSKKVLALLGATALFVIVGLAAVTIQLVNQPTSSTEPVPPVSVTPTEPTEYIKRRLIITDFVDIYETKRYIMDEDGGNQQDLPITGDIYPSWIGRDVIDYVRKDANGLSIAYTYDLRTGEEKELIKLTADREFGVTVSPNGTIYTMSYKEVGDESETTASKWVNGQETVLKTWGARQGRGPAPDDQVGLFFSPDGEYTVLINNLGVNRRSANGRADYSSGNDQLTVYNSNDEIVHEEDGDFNFKVLGFKNESELVLSNTMAEVNRVFVLNLETLAETDLVSFNSGPTLGNDGFSMQLSPDGSKLVMTRGGTADFDKQNLPATVLVIYDLATKSEIKIDNYARGNWLDDSTLIAYKTKYEPGPGGYTEYAISRIDLASSQSVITDLFTQRGISLSYYLEPAE